MPREIAQTKWVVRQPMKTLIWDPPEGEQKVVPLRAKTPKGAVAAFIAAVRQSGQDAKHAQLAAPANQAILRVGGPTLPDDLTHMLDFHQLPACDGAALLFVAPQSDDTMRWHKLALQLETLVQQDAALFTDQVVKWAAMVTDYLQPPNGGRVDHSYVPYPR